MTIIRDGRNGKAAKEFVIIGVGGAGSKSATELSKVLGNPDDVIAVDREADDLRPLSIGRRISIGYPVFAREVENGDDDHFADTSDLFRLKTVIGKAPIVFVMAGLGGNTTLELMPSVLRTAMSTDAIVLAIVTMPFSFEGRTRSNTAGIALERVKQTGCPLALIDADSAISNASIAGDLAAELSTAQARIVMNVLSASSAESLSALNSAPELLDAIKGTGPTFVSYASSEVASEYRKITREAIKAPITSGLELGEADYVSVIVAGPPDTSIKTLNAAVAIVQAETSDDAVLSTSFIPNAENGNLNRLRVTILGGKRSECDSQPSEVGVSDFEAADTSDLEQSVVTESVEDEVNDLFGAPDWLINSPRNEERMPVLL